MTTSLRADASKWKRFCASASEFFGTKLKKEAEERYEKEGKELEE